MSPTVTRFFLICLALHAIALNTLLSQIVPGEINKRENKDSITLREVTIRSDKPVTQSGSVFALDGLLRPVNTSQDLLQLVPGLIIAQHAGGGKAEQIFLRGFDSDHGTDFNISVDGMPVNMVSHAHGQGYADFHFVIPETIGGLRVYKGPYNTRFGDFATSGTGEFFTKNSIESNVVKLEAGMFDTYRALGMVRIGKNNEITDSEHAYAAGEYVFRNAYFNRKQNFNRYNFFTKYSGTVNDNHLLSVSASTFSADWDASGQVPQRAVESSFIDRFGAIGNPEGGQTSRTNVNATMTTMMKENGSVRQQLYYVNYFFNLYSNFTFYLHDPVDGDEINQLDKRNILGYKLTWNKELALFNKRLDIQAGAGTRYDNVQVALCHSVERVIGDTIISGRIHQQNTDAYVESTLYMEKNILVNAGMRVDHFRFYFREDNASTGARESAVRLSPKLNFQYVLNDQYRFFLKSGIGFHSNDARAVVLEQVDQTLPRAFGVELGSECKLGGQTMIQAALWELYLQSELVYVGDEGTVETNFPTNRMGIDLSVRSRIAEILTADIDLNYSVGRMRGAPADADRIPLAPSFTSTGGINYTSEEGFSAGLRYRFTDSRPADESNNFKASGFFLIDAVFRYTMSDLEIGLSVENLFNSKWNQAQFAYESRLYNEPDPMHDLHFTPGTPFFLKGNISYKF